MGIVLGPSRLGRAVLQCMSGLGGDRERCATLGEPTPSCRAKVETPVLGKHPFAKKRLSEPSRRDSEGQRGAGTGRHGQRGAERGRESREGQQRAGQGSEGPRVTARGSEEQ